MLFYDQRNTHSDGGVFSGRSDPLSVRTELDAVDPIGVAFVGEDAAFSTNVPQLDGLVGGSRGQEVSVRMEVCASQSGLVAGQRLQELGRLQVPNLQGARSRTRDNHLLRLSEPHAFYRCRVTNQTLQKTRRKGIQENVKKWWYLLQGVPRMLTIFM